MATDRYATNAFYNYTQFENGVFAGKGVAPAAQDKILKGDNPAFLWPGNNRRIAAGGANLDTAGNTIPGPHDQKIQRGYMRMLAQGFNNSASLERRRLHFQFNPDSITRSVSARNDIQSWMNQDPVNMTQPIPGDANFSFELFFNREREVVSGTYRQGANGPVVASQTPAQLALSGTTSKLLDGSAVTDIGVLSDLMVFDEIIGQGVNSQLIKSVITNASRVNTQARNKAAASKSNEPKQVAEAVATISGGKITKIQVSQTGAGYVVAPIVSITDSTGKGCVAKATFANGKITGVTVTNQGSDYSGSAKVVFTGGGSGSGSSTSDSQDQMPAFFDSDAAYTASNANFGNSAFLVSLPVRIVFSSLFMVEGFITSTNVTFNKFNSNMVPTQCVVGITMQALYIGFAREKTYLTQSLAAGLAASVVDETGNESPQVIEDAKGLKTLAKDLFHTLENFDNSNFTRLNPWGGGDEDSAYKNSDLSPKILFNNGTYKHSFGFRFIPTKKFRNECDKKKITELIASGTIVVEYKGPGAGTGHGTQAVGSKTEYIIENTPLNIEQLGNDDTSTVFTAVATDASKLGVGQEFDTSDTSNYTITLRMFFKVETSRQNTASGNDAQKLIIVKKNVKWADEVPMHNYEIFVPKGGPE
jgi:hypothetical protein